MSILVGATIGIYPGMLPWLGLILVAAALTSTATRDASRSLLLWRTKRVAALIAALAIGTLAVAFIPVWRAARFVVEAAGYAHVSPWPELDPVGKVGIVLGALESPHGHVGAAVWVGIGLVSVMMALSAIAGGRRSVRVLCLAFGSLLATGVVLWAYRDFNYGYYRALMTAGALVGGMAMVATSVADRTRRVRVIGPVLALSCVIVWVGGAAELMERQFDSEPGFRSRELALSRQLAQFPEDAVVLVEGSDLGPSPDTGYAQSQLRMMSGYFVTVGGGPSMEGLWSTPTYYSDGPNPERRPARAWTHVLSVRDTPFDVGRRPIWRFANLVAAIAPELDVTDFGPGWLGVDRDAQGPLKWSQGQAELVVSNRRSRMASVRLRFRAGSVDIDRTLRVESPDGRVQDHRIQADGFVHVAIGLDVPAGGTAAIRLDSYPPAAPPASGDPRSLAYRVDRVRLDVESVPPSLTMTNTEAAPDVRASAVRMPRPARERDR